ncbi:MAG: oligopeptide transporter, OPT family [Planctomycetes bacterium]|nr:oligopeptide transporter, OPT family [Planctomycetota bacterium]
MEVREGSTAGGFRPYVPPEQSPTETTLSGLVVGSILGIVFAASSVYLGLKVGLTVSASIPIAVLSITIFRAFGRATILQNNIVQTTGSAGESIAAGVAFTLPSLLLMGFDLDLVRTTLIALLGGALGVLMMIPLRQGLIVKEHGKLPFPEGTACAQVLIVGDKGGTSAKTVFQGFGIGGLFGLLGSLGRFWTEYPSWRFDRWFKGGSLSFEASPALLGVGYIIGTKTSMIMMAGGVLAFLVLIPLMHAFGPGMTSPLIGGGTLPLAEMSPGQVRNAFVLYIGAGAVATGGILSLLRSMPTILAAFKRGFGSLRAAGEAAPLRTENDLPMTIVVGGSLALVLAIWLIPALGIDFVSSVLIVLFGFFFVTVSSRITGEIGSSSNPISGMTVATLLITCLLFLAVKWTGVSYKEMALTTAALVCVAASNGGTISQSLKTGHLVGATPRRQQAAIMVGVVTSALVIGWTLLYLNRAATTYAERSYPGFTATEEKLREGPPDLLAFAEEREEFRGREYRVLYVRNDTEGVPRGKYLVGDDGKIAFLVDPGVCGVEDKQIGPDGKVEKEVRKYDAPKAQLFRLVIDGVLEQKLPWGLVLVGVFLALMTDLLGVSILPFAVGVYLPFSTSASIFLGGLARHFADKRSKVTAEEAEHSPGVLFSSGLIAGGAIAGLVVAAMKGTPVGYTGPEGVERTRPLDEHLGLGVGLSLEEHGLFGLGPNGWAMLVYGALAFLLYAVAARKPKNG